MIFKFMAQCGDERLPLEVNVAFKPGKQAQRARRVAVGELLAILGAEQATIDASGENQVTLKVGDATWVIM